MIHDDAVALCPMTPDQLDTAYDLSIQGDTRDYVIAGTRDKFRNDHARAGIVYLSIVPVAPGPDGGKLLGYFILALDTDGRSVECRRIVVAGRERGTGKRAMRLLDEYARVILGRDRIWLDVYDFNERGRHVYESTGYRYTGRKEADGKTLLFYEKELTVGIPRRDPVSE